MTNHTARLYAFTISVLVLFLVWAAVATRPWQTHTRAAADPRLKALVVREHRLRKESLVVRRVVAKRWHTYRVQLARRHRQIARAQRKHRQDVAAAQATAARSTPTYSSSTSSPAVQVVTLPPLTITRTS